MKSLIHKSIATFVLAGWVSASHAVLFDLTYDSIANGVIDNPSIVGTGTFSYDGPAIAGSFLLSDLTGVSYSSSFGAINFSGPAFDPLDLSLIGISVTDIGGGFFDLVFTGDSAATNGSLDIVIANGLLSHQPSPLLGNDPGLNLYGANFPGVQFFGDYRATTMVRNQVPAPATLALFGLGLAGLGWYRRKEV